MSILDRHHLPDDIPALKGIIIQLLDMIESQQQVIRVQALRIEEQQRTIEIQSLRIEEQQRMIETQALKLEEQHQVIQAQALKIEQQEKIIEAQAARIESLEHEVGLLKRHRYGTRSEQQIHQSHSQEQRPSHHRTGRQPLPADLPRQQIHHEVEASQRLCQTCGELMNEIGTLSSEQLDLIPAKVVVLEHVRHKYACRRCQDRVVVAEKPAQPIDKGIPTPALLAEILVSKYGDHCPLYRQVQRWGRLGVELSGSTLSRWVIHSGLLLMPIVARMIETALRPCRHVFTDDTPIPVLAPGQGKTRKGRLWIYTTKGSEGYKACTVYDYTPTRQGRGPKEFLQDFQGYIQADAYSGYHEVYDALEGSVVIEIGCWAHARRKFYEITLTSSIPGLAHEALIYIQGLYEVERKATEQGLAGEGRRLFREEHARPQLVAFKKWLLIHQPLVLPKSPIAGAINYTLNQWDALMAYLKQGDLEIDNNRAERGIRPLAIGRKNYLFVGNDKAGRAAAVIYSLIETCKHHNVNPQAYLEYLLASVSTHPQSQIDDLLPWNYQAKINLQKAA